MSHTENRPWGKFEVLYSGSDTKVKIITVNPNQRLSLQYHHKRNETWVVVSGNGLFTLESEDTIVTVGSVLKIPTKAKHRIRNIGSEPLVFVEVQLGESFDESDIVRVEDDYSRNNLKEIL
jgi:mannose-6-phosphate isomerase